jgi:hypothetical protein
LRNSEGKEIDFSALAENERVEHEV